MNLTLLFILFGSFGLKALFFKAPLSGYFGSYQVTNAMMAQMIDWKSWHSIIYPRLTIICEGQPGLHLLYYPFGSFTASALSHLLTQGEMIDFWGRFQASVYTFFSGLLLYRLVKQLFGKKEALIACFIFSFSPMILIEGISFQNEAVAVFFLLLSFVVLLDTKTPYAPLFSGIIFSMSLIARLHFLTCLPALIWFLALQKPTKRSFFYLSMGTFVPLSFWLYFVYHVTMTSPGIFESVFGQLGEGRILDKTLWMTRGFYLRILEILTGPWLTGIIFPFVIWAFCKLRGARIFTFQLWLIGAFAIIILLPQKFHDHPFYLIASVPAASVLFSVFISKKLTERLSWKIITLVLIFFALSMRHYLPPASEGFRKGVRLVKIGKQVQEITLKDDRIIASSGTSAELLFYCNRKGWAFDVRMNPKNFHIKKRHQDLITHGYGNPIIWLEYLRSQGAKYFVTSDVQSLTEQKILFNYLQSTYSQIKSNPSLFLMFDLRRRIA